MRNDQIFVLLLVVLLPLSGCFDGGSVGEAEGAEDSTGTTIVNNYYNNTTTTTNAQERIWHSYGEVVDSSWSDGQDYASGAQRCLEFNPAYDANNTTGQTDPGSNVNECLEMGYPQNASDWDSSECEGELLQAQGGCVLWSYDWKYGPTCEVSALTIITTPGEALLLYEMNSITITSTCDGIQSSSISSVSTSSSYGMGGEEYRIVPGSALNCSHEILYYQGYAHLTGYNYGQQTIVSLVYAIQDTVVV